MTEINLTPELAQKIADRTMEILNYNINIRDEKGRIIASGEKNRIGDSSKMAAEGIADNKILRITQKEAEGLEGMEHGVQIPINFINEVIGAVDITGVPEEVENYVGMVKMTAELMLQQAYYLQKVQMKEQADEQFIKDIIRNTIDYNDKSIASRAEIFGYNNKDNYLVFLLEVSNFWEILLEKVGRTNSIEFQKHKKNLINKFNNIFIKNLKIKTIHLEQEKFIIIAQSDEEMNIKKIYEKAKNIIIKLNREYKFNYKLAAGGSCEGLKGLRKSYKTALQTLKLGIKFHPNEEVYYYDNQELERIADNLSAEIIEDILNRGSLEEHFLKTLKEYFNTNMNISQAADNLSLHRNSVIYRLKRIKEKTGLDPTKTDDIVILRLYLLYMY